MDRDEFIDLLTEELSEDPDNNRLNRILEAADEYAENEKAQLSKKDMTKGTTSDTISRQAAIDVIEDYPHGNVWNVESMEEMVDKIKALTSVQPETAKRIVGKVRDGMTLWYQCDMCNEPVDEQDNYCRGCGRRLIDG